MYLQVLSELMLYFNNILSVFCFLDRAFSMWKTQIIQQNAQINSG